MLVRLVALLCGSPAQVAWLSGGRWVWFRVVRLAGLVLRGVWVCRLVWLVRLMSAWLPSLGACALVPCPLGVDVPRSAPGSAGRGGVVPSGLLIPLPACLRASVSSPVLGVAAVSPFPSGVRAMASVLWPLQWNVPGSSPGG